MKEFILPETSDFHQKIDFAKELNGEQLAVVEGGDGATLVLAGAGSGKTRTITYRVAWLLAKGVLPENILLLTFTNKAAKEMIHRVTELFGEYPSGLWSGTFHSIANRLLRTYAYYIGYSSNFSILDQEDSGDLVSLCIKELKINTKGKRFPTGRVLQSFISFQRNKSISIEEALEIKHPNYLAIQSEIAQVAELYEKQKRAQNTMDFDDLLLRLLELLRTNEQVAQQLSNQFHYLLVDEFQDTNVVQAEIVKRLSTQHGNVLVVGDDAQSIYSFRAAEIQNILRFPKDYTNAKMFRLVVNYRSTPQILAVANEVIAHNEDQFAKELTSIQQNGEKPNLVPCSSVAEEARYIAEQIRQLHQEGSPLNEIAVLFRAAYHSQALEFELMRNDFPYEYRGGMKFFERSHIKDVVAHLRVRNNLKDGMAWSRILRIHPGIGMTTAAKIAAKIGELPSLEMLDLIGTIGGKRAEAGFEGMRRVMREVLQAGILPSRIIRAVAANTEYKAYLEAEFLNFEERLEDIEQFAVFAEQYGDLTAFLEAVGLTDEFATSEEKERVDDRLILSTIHQAKGLEWNTVFVMRLTDGAFPSKRSMASGEGIEEERRLFYVAVTRARKNLIFTYPLSSGYEHVEIEQPSMFLEEVPSKLLEEVKLRRTLASTTSYRSAFEPSYQDEDAVIVLDDDGEKKNVEPSHYSFFKDI